MGESGGSSDTAAHSRALAEADAGRVLFRRRNVLLGGGALLGGAAIAGGPRLTTAKSAKEDAEALNLVLLVEYAEHAFYEEALRENKLRGAIRTYVETVSKHEAEHLAFLKKALGKAAAKRPDHDFGQATTDSDAFVTRAASLEDLAVAAYNGQATNLRAQTLAAAAKIVSVEARHAAWIRSIVGRPPAPDTTDTPLTAKQVLSGLTDAGQKR